VKSAGEIMEILEAFDLTECYRDAGELAGCSHHTVARYVTGRDGGALSDRPAARPQLIDAFLPKVEEWVERSRGKIRADVAHRKLRGLGYAGSERTTRRAVGKPGGHHSNPPSNRGEWRPPSSAEAAAEGDRVDADHCCDWSAGQWLSSSSRVTRRAMSSTSAGDRTAEPCWMAWRSSRRTSAEIGICSSLAR